MYIPVVKQNSKWFFLVNQNKIKIQICRKGSCAQTSVWKNLLIYLLGPSLWAQMPFVTIIGLDTNKKACLEKEDTRKWENRKQMDNFFIF